MAALGMLICGETVLKGKLRDLTFIAYWMICFALTGMAIVVAFVDARALRRHTRKEQRDLFETSLKEIQAEARTRPGRPDRSQRQS
jgi:hypothetical protein